MRNISYFLKIFVEILLVFLLIPLVFVLITSRTGALGGMRSLVVLTGSMEPTYPVGSVVVTRPQAGYFPGEAISFKNASGLIVTHRIIEKIGKSDGFLFRVKGDANSRQDQELVSQNQILGKAVFDIPYLGRGIVSLKDPKIFALLVIIPSVAFIVLEIFSIKNELEKGIEKKVLDGMQTI